MRMQERKNHSVHFMGFVLFLLLLCIAPTFASAAVVQPCDELITGLLCSGAKLHVLCQKSCYEVDENNALQPCTLGCANQGIFSVVTTADGKTYGVSWGGLYEWNPEGKKVWQNIGTAPMMRYWAANGNMLFGVLVDAVSEDTREHISGYNMDNGQLNDIISFPQYSILPATATSDGSFIYLYNNDSTLTFDLYSIEPVTKRISLISSIRWADVNGQVNYLAADNKNGYYMLTSNAIYHLSDEGKLSLINYVPAHSLGDTRQLVVNQERGMFYFFGYTLDYENLTQALYAVPIEPDTEQKILRVAGHNYSSYYYRKAILDFQTAHPEVQVVMLDGPTTFEEISEALVARLDTFDLMALISHDGGLRTSINKGYCVDLSDMPGITETMQGLYPVFRDEVMRNGKVFAIPLTINWDTGIGYNQELWKKLELGEIPQTYDQLFDLIEQWLTEDTLGVTPIFDSVGSIVDGRDMYQTLFAELLRATAARDMLKGNAPVYQQEDLLHLLHRLEKLRPLIQSYEKQYHEGTGVLSRGRYELICDENSEIHYMPLGFNDQNDRGLDIRLEAMVVNPMSKQQELAKEFISMLMENVWVQEQYTMYFKDEAYPGIEMQDYEKKVKELEELLDYWESEVKRARLEHDVVEYYQQSAEYTRQSLEDTISRRWVVSPEAAAYGRSQMPYVTLQRENGVRLIDENAAPQISSYQNGNITAEELCKRFDDIQRMWEMENE